MDKGIYINELKPNVAISGVFIISNPTLNQSQGGPYWKFILSDLSGMVDGKIWFPRSKDFIALPNSMPVQIAGRTSLYRERLQVSVSDLEEIDEDNLKNLDKTAFLPMGNKDSEKMFLELCALCQKELTYGPWKKFVSHALKDPEICDGLKAAPAAKHVHQSYLGGLLEHTLNVVKNCQAIADNYPELDRQILLAGAIFHDIGKIWEFTYQFNIDYSTGGALLGHLYLGLEKLQPFLAKSGLEEDLQYHFKHLILSHHGEYEYGSPKLPQTAEAFVLHFADNLDAKLAQCRQLFQDEDENKWSDWQKTLERRILKPKHTPEVLTGIKPPQENECLSLLKE